jgi:hypothetical protein
MKDWPLTAGQYEAALACAVELLSATKPLWAAPTHVIAIWQLAAALKEKRDITDGQLNMLVRVAIGERRKRGGDANRKRGRNISICAAIEGVNGRFGFDFTRNQASTTPSACSIVAEALNQLGENLTEAAVVKIWDKRSYISEMGADGGPIGRP